MPYSNPDNIDPDIEDPTGHERLRDWINDLEKRVKKEGLSSSMACNQVDSKFVLWIKDAPEDVKKTACRIRRKCWQKNFIARVFLILNRDILIVLTILIILSSFVYIGVSKYDLDEKFSEFVEQLQR